MFAMSVSASMTPCGVDERKRPYEVAVANIAQLLMMSTDMRTCISIASSLTCMTELCIAAELPLVLSAFCVVANSCLHCLHFYHQLLPLHFTDSNYGVIKAYYTCPRRATSIKCCGTVTR